MIRSLMQPKRKQNAGPPRHEAPLGETYRNPDTGQRWIMGPQGWELAVTLQIAAVGSDKGHWINAARQEKMTLEEWVNQTLNEAAAKYELPTEPR